MMRNCFKKEPKVASNAIQNLGEIFKMNKKYVTYAIFGIVIYFAVRNIKPLNKIAKKIPLVSKIV